MNSLKRLALEFRLKCPLNRKRGGPRGDSSGQGSAASRIKTLLIWGEAEAITIETKCTQTSHAWIIAKLPPVLPGPWKHCLPQHQSWVPNGLGTAVFRNSKGFLGKVSGPLGGRWEPWLWWSSSGSVWCSPVLSPSSLDDELLRRGLMMIKFLWDYLSSGR